jgi:hypothetical protein
MSPAAWVGDAVGLRGVKLNVLFVVDVLTKKIDIVRGINQFQIHFSSKFPSNH